MVILLAIFYLQYDGWPWSGTSNYDVYLEIAALSNYPYHQRIPSLAQLLSCWIRSCIRSLHYANIFLIFNCCWTPFSPISHSIHPFVIYSFFLVLSLSRFQLFLFQPAMTFSAARIKQTSDNRTLMDGFLETIENDQFLGRFSICSLESQEFLSGLVMVIFLWLAIFSAC